MSDPSHHDRTLNRLEREAERTRADLVNTVEELRERVSPSQVKEDVKEYARNTGQDFVSNLVEKARENPLQTAAIAAAIAYPAWHMIRTIPLPVLLLGAGAVLAGQVKNGGYAEGLASRFGLGGDHADRDGGYEGWGAGDYRADRAGAYEDWDAGEWGYASNGGGSVRDFIDRNPTLVTGLGLLVGAMIGGSLTASGALHRSRDSEEFGGMPQ
jgi:hypothetical protein